MEQRCAATEVAPLIVSREAVVLVRLVVQMEVVRLQQVPLTTACALKGPYIEMCETTIVIPTKIHDLKLLNMSVIYSYHNKIII